VIILAVDTTSETGSVAIRSHGVDVAEVAIESKEGLAHLLFSGIERLLEQASIRVDEIDCFAAASGPGSFTGLRVGLSAIKGLAEATGKPAIGVSNLRAMSSFGNLPVRAVLMDARRGEIYGGVYDSELRALTEESVGKIPNWLETLDLPDYEFIAPAGSSFRNLLERTRFACMRFIEVPRNLAAAVGRCAELAGPGKWQDPAAIDANYVRRSDAELFWRD
jgi:tRNA threonylcarbamoyladenosine biosynthesis protein TsaB